MSKVVDERIVSMQFDNSGFEKNVSNTMSALDRLKHALKLDGASKGLNEVDAAAKKVNMSELGNSVETVSAKFSALQVVGVTALANITNSAVDAGKKLVKSLSVDQVSAGWDKYSAKMANMKTLMNATGKDVDEISGYLDRLMWFSDETSYSFSDMSSGLATMVASGGDIEKLIPMIEGVANATAFAGKGAAEFSRVLQYGVNQAYSLGYMQVQDWKTLEGATVNSKQLMESLIAAGEATGKISKGSVTASNFRESLKNKWLDKTVMEQGFGKFAEFTTAVEKFVNGDISGFSKEIQDLWHANADGIDTAADAMKLLEPYYDELGVKAFESAQQCKTFSEAIEATKDAVSSGWLRTFELIFGNVEQATKLWTDLCDVLWDVFAAGAEVRNYILEIALNFSKPWDAILEKLGKINKVTSSVKDAIGTLEYFQDVVWRVWHGEFNNHGDPLDRKDLLEAAGYNDSVVQYLVNLGGISGKKEYHEITIEDIREAHEKFGLTLEMTEEETKELANSLNDLSDAQLRDAGLTESEIALYHALKQEADKLGISVTELGDRMADTENGTDGRSLLIQSFANIGNMFLGIGKAAKAAWNEIFNPPGSEVIAVKLYSLINAIQEFTSKLRITETVTNESGEEVEQFTELGGKLTRIFKGLVAVLDIVRIVLGGPITLVLRIVKEILGFFGLSILDVAAFLGDMLVGLRNTIKGLFDFSSIISKVAVPIKKAYEAFQKWIDSLKDSKDLPKDIAKGIASGFGKALTAVKNFIKSIPKFFKSIPSLISGVFDGSIELPNWMRYIGIVGETIYELGKMAFVKIKEFLSATVFKGISIDSISGLVNGLKQGVGKVWNAALEIAKSVLESICGFLGIHSPSKEMFDVAGHVISGFVLGIKNGANSVWQVIKGLFGKLIDWVKELDFGNVVAALVGVGLVKAATTAGGALSKLATPIEGFGELLGSLSTSIVRLTGPMRKVLKGFAAMERSIAFNITMEGVKTLAISILILAGAVALLTLCDPKELWNAVFVIAALAGILAVLAIAMSKIGTASATFSFKNGLNVQGMTMSLIGIGAAILLMAAAVKMIGQLDPEQAKQGFLGLAGLVVAIGVVILALTLLSKVSNDVQMAAIGSICLGIAAALLIMVIAVKSAAKLNDDQLIQAAKFVAGFIVFVGLLALIGGLGGKAMTGMGAMLMGISVSLILMVGVVKLAAGIKQDEMVRAADFLLLFTGMIAILALVGAAGGVAIKGVGSMMLSLSVSLLLMVLVVKLLANIDNGDLIKGGIVIAAFTAMIVLLINSIKYSGKHAAKVAVAIFAFAIAIGILAGVAIICSMISEEGLIKGVSAVTVLSLLMVALMRSTKGIGKSTGSIIGIAIIIGVLVAAVAVLSTIKPSKLFPAVAAISILLVMLTIFIASARKSGKAYGAIIALAGVLLAIAGALYILADVPAEQSIGSALAISILLGVMTGILAILTTIGKKAKKALWGAVALAALGVVLAELGLVLAMMSALGVKDTIPNIISLSILLGVMTHVVTLLSAVGKKAKKALWGALALAALGGVLAELVLVLALMNALGVKDTIPNVIALSLLIGVMTIVVSALSTVGAAAKNALWGALALAALGGVLAVFVLVLALMSALNVKDAIPNVIALSILCAVLTAVLPTLMGVGILIASSGGTALLGIVALLAMAVPLLAFVGIIALMSGIQNGIENCRALTDLMVVLSAVLIAVSLIAPLVMVGVTAIGAMIGLMVVLGALAVGIGYLMTEFPQLQEFLNTGLPILEQLAYGLGAMIGAFIAALADAVLGILPALGTALSDFMKNAEPFIAIAKTCDTSVLAGVGIIAAAVVALTAAELIEGIAGLFGLSLEDLGSELSKFMIAALPFITIASTINPTALNGVKTIAETILLLTASNVLEGLTSWFTGGSSLEKFASELPLLGKGLKGFSEGIGTFSGDQLATVEAAANAVKILAEASNAIPNTGGLLAELVGENDLGSFAREFPKLGTGLRNFLTNVGTFSDVEISTVTAAADAVKTLASAASEIPNSGGWVSAIVGENDLGTFAKQFPKLGEGLAGFLEKVGGTLTTDQCNTLTSGADAVKALATAASEIPNTGGWVEAIIGNNDLEAFAGQFPALGKGLAGFLKAINEGGGLSTTDQATLEIAAKTVETLAGVAQKLPGAGNAISKLFGEEDKFASFATGMGEIGSGLKKFVENAGHVTPAKLAALDTIATFVKAVLGIMQYDLGSKITGVETIVKLMPGIAETLDSFVDKMPTFDDATAAINTFKHLVNGMNIIGGVEAEAVSNFADALSTLGSGCVEAFIDKFSSQTNRLNLQTAAFNFAGYAVTGASKYAFGEGNTMEGVGKDFGDGLIKGINSKKQEVFEAGKALGKKAVEGEKKGQNSASPSKETIKAGKWLGEGLIIGMNNMGSAVYNAGKDMGVNAVGSIANSIRTISNAIDTDMNLQPTIRPVIDLSDAKTGVNAISEMFAGVQGVGVQSNIGAVNLAMNNKLQNRSESNIVSAINKLNDGLANNRGDTYSIGGINVSEGTEAANAIRTLVRVIKMEGRS